MKTRNHIFPLLLVIAAFGVLEGRTVQADEGLYQAYLRSNCWGGETGTTIGKVELAMGAIGISTGGLAAVASAGTGAPAGMPIIAAGGLILLDGVGRQIGGTCSGLTGLDDLILAPTLGMVDSSIGVARAVYERSTGRKDTQSGSNALAEAGPSKSANGK